MTAYPEELSALSAALLGAYGQAGDIRALVAKAGGDPNQVDLQGKASTVLYNALAVLYRNPGCLLRLGSAVRTDGLWDAAIEQALTRVLVAATSDGTVRWPYPIGVEEVGRQLAEVYPTVAQCLDIARRAGVSEPQLRNHIDWYGGDATRTWCNALVVAALDQRLTALVGWVSSDQKDSRVIQGLVLRLSQETAQPSTSPPTLPRTSGERQDTGPSGARGLVATRTQNPSRGGHARDPRDAVALAIRRSALDTLENLRKEMDGALATFGREDARDAEPPRGEDSRPDDFADAVNRLAADIDEEILVSGSPDATVLLRQLHQLVANVLRGLELAEVTEEFGIIEMLAGQAASAYESVAKCLGGERGEILGRVVPYWRMKATHARHLAKVQEQKRRLEVSTPRGAAQNPPSATVPTPAFPSPGAN